MADGCHIGKQSKAVQATAVKQKKFKIFINYKLNTCASLDI